MRGGFRGALAVAMMAAAAPLVGCMGDREGAGGESEDRDRASAKPMEQKTIEEVLAERTEEWMFLPGVVGTGIGACDGEPCIKVFVAGATDELRRALPDTVEGFAVRLEVTGSFRPRGIPPNR